MTQINRQQKILVASSTADLAGITRQAVSDAIEVGHASSRSEALEKARTTRPDLIIVGDMGPPDAVLRFCRELREGWISRHSSLLVVVASGDSYRVFGDEHIEALSGELVPAPGTPIPLTPHDSLPAALKEAITRKLAERRNKLKSSLLDPDRFCLIWEQIPGLGAFELRQQTVLDNAARASRGGKVCAISVTDNPGGNPAIATEILSREIHKLGVEPLVHVAFRDRSRNQCESLLYQLAAMEINNLLVLTGDYPANTGFEGTSRPVFDLDSVTGLQLVSEMNKGMKHEIMRKQATLAPTSFFSGVAFSPFKRDEAEVTGQYLKLKKKIQAGADFVITQVGYDVRKLHELQLWLKTHDHKIPAVASIYVLPLATAKAMHANHIPGCVVTDKLLAQVAQESAGPDKGRQARLDRAARMYAIARGLGFAGASISGQELPYESVEYVSGKGEEWRDNWRDFVHEFDYPQENGFYFFERDETTGLNLETLDPRKQKPSYSPVYHFSRAVHASVFEPASPLFKALRRLAPSVDSSRVSRKVFGAFEFWTKAALYGCYDCGDCALADVAYLCPVSQCPKNQRNGPCGGSHAGWCEVYPNEKKCIWVRAYLRLKSHHKEDAMGAYMVPPCNWELWGTPSWLNYFMGRDHVAKRAGIEGRGAKEKRV